jgi:MOSC domain-containing protein YiiM
MKLLSVNVAVVGELFTDRSPGARRVATGIHKKPVSGAVVAHKRGLAGDQQADRKLHGGPDKAVYAYPVEHYVFWTAQRQASFRTEPLAPGSMGENLTLEGVLENALWIGDRLHIGEAVLEVTEPRSPCFKFNVKMDLPHASKLMLQSGYTGFYLRVVQCGAIRAGDAVEVAPGPRAISVARVNEQRRRGRQRDLF